MNLKIGSENLESCKTDQSFRTCSFKPIGSEKCPSLDHDFMDSTFELDFSNGKSISRRSCLVTNYTISETSTKFSVMTYTCKNKAIRLPAICQKPCTTKWWMAYWTDCMYLSDNIAVLLKQYNTMVVIAWHIFWCFCYWLQFLWVSTLCLNYFPSIENLRPNEGATELGEESFFYSCRAGGIPSQLTFSLLEQE